MLMFARKLQSIFFLLVFSVFAGGSLSAAEELRAAEVAAALKRSSEWQLANPTGTDITDWVIAPLYDGLLRAAITTGERGLMEAVARFGQQAGWSPRWRPYHADDHAVGHAWLDIYLLDPTRKERLAPVKEALDFVLAHPITEELDFRKQPQSPGVAKTDRWTWCDALYMAPPTLARLHTATGDARYLEFLDAEFRECLMSQVAERAIDLNFDLRL
ncbi:MAG: glycoside hydrolase family 88 protein [Opitutaceae bacterium]